MRAMRWIASAGLIVLLAGAAAAAPAWTPVDRVAAVVNDSAILASDVGRRVAQYKAAVKTPPEPDKAAQQDEAIHSAAVRDLCDEMLLAQEAARLRIEAPDAEIDMAVEQVKQQNKFDDAALARALAANGITLQIYRDELRRQITRLRVIDRVIRPKVDVSEKAVRDLYMAEKQQNPKLGEFEAEKERLQQAVFEREIVNTTEKWLLQRRASSYIEVRQ
ncbi:MAG TPA: SurA N-terminal domain-containing protein [Kofleriaceae bacterium]|nr:SurA N-terminal domain-containing protein [Kofleriaceae bacterium]